MEVDIEDLYNRVQELRNTEKIFLKKTKNILLNKKKIDKSIIIKKENNTNICPNCGDIFRGNICPNCGYLVYGY